MTVCRYPLPVRLPTVLMTDVVRSTHQGESHGGAYLINLATGEHDKVLDWNTVDIDWAGRGQGRGLRGIVYHDDHTLIAASDELYLFDRAFNIVESFRCPFLRHAHETALDAGSVYVTSTTYDAVLEFDLAAGRFTRGTHLRVERTPASKTATVRPVAFDPNGSPTQPNAPEPKDQLHINSVSRAHGSTFVSGTRLPGLFRLDGERIEPWANIPAGTHNAQPLGTHVVFNSTQNDAVCLADRRGRVLRAHKAYAYEPDELEHADIPNDYARQGFLRGLCTTPEGLIIVGSSPSTVCAYHPKDGLVARVNVTMDVRNCPHGLEVWPFA